MAKVAVLVPNQELERIAQPLTEEFSSLQVMEVKYIRTAYAGTAGQRTGTTRL